MLVADLFEVTAEGSDNERSLNWASNVVRLTSRSVRAASLFCASSSSRTPRSLIMPWDCIIKPSMAPGPRNTGRTELSNRKPPSLRLAQRLCASDVDCCPAKVIKLRALASYRWFINVPACSVCCRRVSMAKGIVLFIGTEPRFKPNITRFGCLKPLPL